LGNSEALMAGVEVMKDYFLLVNKVFLISY